ncbi:conserved hypothetical protein [Theileria equi strain WA]|uniref:Uncharacterized protein n=1 Tax=Theileria equi strain WA TaxID=1537102 RepID=L1LE76_THEEQ|nr:conserved hypothetical protein [Theileria equi strain WA]EKX73463.1 conserved hypothetical protein [Theileria equi strain WA]|eukprot:XP_004832915.1 conserved hypothetical protein [Theileria equi strain WA]
MIDLNVAWPGAEGARRYVKDSSKIGWSTIGFNVYFKADKNGVQPLKVETDFNIDNLEEDLDETPVASVDNLMTSVIGTSVCIQDISLGKDFLRRATILLSEGLKPHTLTKFVESKDYDILSVIPTCQKTFQSACEIVNCDVINMDVYCLYSPFKIKRGLVTSALQRGCFFEVSLSGKDICNALKVHQVVGTNHPGDLSMEYRSNFSYLLRYIPLKKLVISSGSASLRNIMDPNLIIGMCNELFTHAIGEPCDVRCCVTKAPEGCILKGAARRTYGTGIVSCNKNDTIGQNFI